MTANKWTSFFGLVYSKSGGIAGRVDRISYESITRKLIFVDRSNRKSEKQLEVQDEDKLKHIISENKFFEIAGSYPSKGSMADHYSYTLSVTMDGQIQEANWADDSEGTPKGLLNIESAIGQMAPGAPTG